MALVSAIGASWRCARRQVLETPLEFVGKKQPFDMGEMGENDSFTWGKMWFPSQLYMRKDVDFETRFDGKQGMNRMFEPLRYVVCTACLANP